MCDMPIFRCRQKIYPLKHKLTNPRRNCFVFPLYIASRSLVLYAFNFFIQSCKNRLFSSPIDFSRILILKKFICYKLFYSYKQIILQYFLNFFVARPSPPKRAILFYKILSCIVN